jgi:hypothetical protein
MARSNRRLAGFGQGGGFIGWDKLLFGDGTLRVASGKGHIVWQWSFGLVCWLADFMVTYVSQIA